MMKVIPDNSLENKTRVFGADGSVGAGFKPALFRWGDVELGGFETRPYDR
jgi:hypothetical protein